MDLFKLNSKQQGTSNLKSDREILKHMSRIDRKPYQMVHLNVVREYLILDLGNTNTKPAFEVRDHPSPIPFPSPSFPFLPLLCIR